MAKTAQDIIRLIQEQDIKMVDFKRRIGTPKG